jgi:hypothetical protein
MDTFLKKPCPSCPFRKDVTPFLRPRRAEELAYLALNPYSDFSCHNTFEYDGDEDHQGRATGDFSKTKTCAGFLTVRATELEQGIPEGFEPSWDLCYESAEEMVDVYEAAYESQFD